MINKVFAVIKKSKVLIFTSCLLMVFVVVSVIGVFTKTRTVEYHYEASSAAPAASEAAAASSVEADPAVPLPEGIEELKSQLSDISQKEGGGTSTLTSAPENRKIITTIDIQLESTEYDKCAQEILDAIKRSDGYIESSDMAGSIETSGVKDMSIFGMNLANHIKPLSAQQSQYYGRRYMRLKIRVPQSGLSAFMSEIESYGNILSKQENAKDVTLEYVDVESHKKALALEQERLLAMLEKAQTVEDMIKLEERLSEVRFQLERYESQLRVLENQISYSTVNLTLDEVLIYTEKPEEPIPQPTVAQRISIGMTQTFNDIGNYWVNMFVWVMVNLVYIIGVIIVLVIAFIVIKRYYRRSNLRKLLSESFNSGKSGESSGNDSEQNDKQK